MGDVLEKLNTAHRSLVIVFLRHVEHLRPGLIESVGDNARVATAIITIADETPPPERVGPHEYAELVTGKIISRLESMLDKK